MVYRSSIESICACVGVRTLCMRGRACLCAGEHMCVGGGCRGPSCVCYHRRMSYIPQAAAKAAPKSEPADCRQLSFVVH